jgi:hypothetical protein
VEEVGYVARSRRSKPDQQDPGNTQTKERKSNMSVEELNADQIAELLASSRQRGVYDAELKSFWESDNPGVKVNLESGVFAGKKAQSVKTGFETARKRDGAPEGAGDNLRVILQEDAVYLIRGDMQ